MSSWTRCYDNKFCCCLFSFLRWIPVIFIVAVIGWSYYAYVVQLCINLVETNLERVVYLIPYHVILAVFLWSYWQCAMAKLVGPPLLFGIPNELFKQVKSATVSQQRSLMENFAKDLPVMTRTFDGSIRFCEHCRTVKPDRCHHCSVCGICVLKMDHHCPWVNTCVSYANYKFFVLFLGYALLYCVFIALTDLKFFIMFWQDRLPDDDTFGKFHIMFLFFVACMFAFSVSCLFFYHLYLTSRNRSTIENFRAPVFRGGPDPNGFSLGCSANFQEVFGDKRRLWAVPIFTSFGDGVRFPVRTYDYECQSLLRPENEYMDERTESDSDPEDDQALRTIPDRFNDDYSRSNLLAA